MRFVILTVVMFLWGFSATTFGEEEKTDDRVFGLRWKMSAQEIVKLRLGKPKDIRNSFGKSELEFENPKSPKGASTIELALFNNQLYQITVTFIFKNDYDLNRKYEGLSQFLAKKHTEAKAKETDMYKGKIFILHYAKEDGEVTQNPQNLESINVMTIPPMPYHGTSGYMSIVYSFYGAGKIFSHIKELEEKAEFGEF